MISHRPGSSSAAAAPTTVLAASKPASAIACMRAASSTFWWRVTSARHTCTARLCVRQSSTPAPIAAGTEASTPLATSAHSATRGLSAFGMYARTLWCSALSSTCSVGPAAAAPPVYCAATDLKMSSSGAKSAATTASIDWGAASRALVASRKYWYGLSSVFTATSTL